MKFPFKEPLFPKYLYIGEDNIVHVLMPIVSGTRIGLDNTCKAVFSLQEFFGKGTYSNQKATIKDALIAYQEALESDLILLGTSNAALTQQKKERLMQINAYVEVVKQLEKSPELHCLDQNYPRYPRPLEACMQDRETSNLYSIVLRPTEEDAYLLSEAANPIFRVAHRSMIRKKATVRSPLQEALIRAYSALRYEARDLKSQLIQRTLTNLGIRPDQIPCDFNALRQSLQREVDALLPDMSLNFSKTTQENTPITQKFIDEILYFDPQTTKPTEYIEALFSYCASGLFDMIVESPFQTLTTAETWSVATQFLLGIINFYYITTNKIAPDTNFGQILDNNPDLSNNLAQTLAQAQRDNRNIEETCLSWLRIYAKRLHIENPLTQEDVYAIKKIFVERYAEIKQSPHFDEFFLLDEHKKGSFFTYQGSICVLFAKFANSPLFALPTNVMQPLEKALSTSSSLPTEIPHKKQLIQRSIDVDISCLENSALQVVYEQIHGYHDHRLKKQLFAQLKQERPDFKPQIDAKQFLQHIAYGEQDEAEALLKRDFDFAQELLKAHNIPFTDYSGRTFTCTAYEYAYWAKDTHMQRMLERYIQNDEETRQFIVERVNAIEELVTPAPSSCFSRFFAATRPLCRGLHYTTQNKHGKIIDHWEAHFDISPLKKALKTYIDAHRKSPKRRASDWNPLNKLWIKVGLPQRQLPAHFAQEYCHPNRSFQDILNNPALLDASNPSNLKRQLTFLNRLIHKQDLWFTRDTYTAPFGLGHSFAMVRSAAARAECSWGFAGQETRSEVCDFSALDTIDKTRTEDLKQSLENLSRPVHRSSTSLAMGE